MNPIEKARNIAESNIADELKDELMGECVTVSYQELYDSINSDTKGHVDNITVDGHRAFSSPPNNGWGEASGLLGDRSHLTRGLEEARKQTPLYKPDRVDTTTTPARFKRWVDKVDIRDIKCRESLMSFIATNRFHHSVEYRLMVVLDALEDSSKEGIVKLNVDDLRRFEDIGDSVVNALRKFQEWVTGQVVVCCRSEGNNQGVGTVPVDALKSNVGFHELKEKVITCINENLDLFIIEVLAPIVVDVLETRNKDFVTLCQFIREYHDYIDRIKIDVLRSMVEAVWNQGHVSFAIINRERVYSEIKMYFHCWMGDAKYELRGKRQSILENEQAHGLQHDREWASHKPFSFTRLEGLTDDEQPRTAPLEVYRYIQTYLVSREYSSEVKQELIDLICLAKPPVGLSIATLDLEQHLVKALSPEALYLLLSIIQEEKKRVADIYTAKRRV